MAMALPVVATNISGIPELVEHGVNGLLVPQRNIKALAGALALLLQDPDLRSRLGENARRTIGELFDSQETTRALHDLFVRCLEDQLAVQMRPLAMAEQTHDARPTPEVT
jgi:glycosyltransferase involved in cell wall biosynthesis